MSESYFEKLKDPRWQKKRLEILQRADFSCEWCGDKSSTLFIHHGYYTRGYEPWDYGEDTLYSLCKHCHEEAESLKHDIHLEIARIHPKDHRDFFMALMQWKSSYAKPKLNKVAEMPPIDVPPSVPVLVVGVSNGKITETGHGSQAFSDLSEAQALFPDLNPNQNTERFTSAMKEIKAGKVIRFRFDTWKAYEIYST